MRKQKVLALSSDIVEESDFSETAYNGLGHLRVLGQMPVPPIPNSARANAQTFPNSRTQLQKSTMPNETLLFIYM